MLIKYINFTILAGTLRAAAIMSTEKYKEKNKNILISDKAFMCLLNGICTPVVLPYIFYMDVRKLEFYLRNKNNDALSSSFLLLYDWH